MKKRLLPAAAGGAALTVLLLFSPFYRLLAAPLTLKTPLTSADAIVVLGGGVDREGNPGESTVERVRYGAALYKEEFAPVLVLSTGKVDRFNEARVMQSLALSLNVPQRAILLEEDSHNTYENVLFTERLLKQKGWNRPIIVSSPYHMRRIDLLYQKFFPEVSPLYAPVRPSLFHEPGSSMQRFRQALALYREYAAIVWYRLKGRI